MKRVTHNPHPMSNAGKVEAKEHRIGNLVLCSSTYDRTPQSQKSVFAIDSINKGSIKIENNTRTIEIADVIPVPLTEEWLVKFGFEYDKGNGYRIDIGGANLWIELSGEYAIGVPYEAGGGNFKILYVHQLMNLFHSLTGAELEVK